MSKFSRDLTTFRTLKSLNPHFSYKIVNRLDPLLKGAKRSINSRKQPVDGALGPLIGISPNTWETFFLVCLNDSVAQIWIKRLANAYTTNGITSLPFQKTASYEIFNCIEESNCLRKKPNDLRTIIKALFKLKTSTRLSFST